MCDNYCPVGDIVSVKCKVPHLYIAVMDIKLLEGFVNWSQTPLGANIVGPLAVAIIVGLFLVSRRYIRSIPGRLFRWMERKAEQHDATPPTGR